MTQTQRRRLGNVLLFGVSAPMLLVLLVLTLYMWLGTSTSHPGLAMVVLPFAVLCMAVSHMARRLRQPQPAR